MGRGSGKNGNGQKEECFAEIHVASSLPAGVFGRGSRGHFFAVALGNSDSCSGLHAISPASQLRAPRNSTNQKSEHPERCSLNNFGAEGGTRTPTPLRVHGPEPCASANSATTARCNRPSESRRPLNRESLVSQRLMPLSIPRLRKRPVAPFSVSLPTNRIF